MFKIESYRRGIVLSTVFNIFNKGLIFLNGIIIAYFFGVNRDTDIFFLIYNSLIILSAFCMNMNSAVIIPESMSLRRSDDSGPSMRFLNFFIALYALVSLVALFAILPGTVSFFSFISNFPQPQLLKRSDMLYLSLPLLVITCLVTLLTDILTSYKYFTVPMVVGIINGAVSILCTLAFHDQVGLTITLYALLLSYTLNFLLLVYLLRRHLKWKFSFSTADIPRRVWKNLGFANLSNLSSTLSLYTPIYLLSGLNPGIITALTFSQQISALPVSLIVNQFSAVSGIKFNELYAQHNYPEISRIFALTANFLLFITIPISAIFFIFSDPIVILLLQHGAFTESGTRQASLFLKYLGLLLPMTVLNTLFARLFMATRNIKVAFWYQLIFNIVLVIQFYVLIPRYGILGYPMTLISNNLLSILCCYFIEKRFLNIIEYIRVLKSLGVFFLINLAVGTVIFLVMRNVSLASQTIHLLSGVSLYAVLIIFISWKLHLNETINSFLRQMFNKLRPG